MSNFIRLNEISAAAAEKAGLTKVKAEWTAINERTGEHREVSLKGYANDVDGISYIEIIDDAEEAMEAVLTERGSPVAGCLLVDGTFDAI